MRCPHHDNHLIGRRFGSGQLVCPPLLCLKSLLPVVKSLLSRLLFLQLVISQLHKVVSMN